MNKKLISFISLITLVFGMVQVVPIQTVSAAAHNGPTVVLTSAAAENKAYWVDLRSYPYDDANLVTPWPKRAENCTAATGKTYKTMPWLGDAGEINGYGGNLMLASGNCTDRYWDGGTGAAPGPWIAPGAYGGWANKGTSTLGNATTIWDGGTRSNAAYPCTVADYGTCTGHFSDAPQIWGMDHRYGRYEAVDQYKDLYDRFARLGGTATYGGAVNGFYLFSSGTTLFRNEFTMTAGEIALTDHLTLNLKADDFVRVYLNGVAIATGTGSATSANNNILTDIDGASVRSLLSSTETNVLAIQVSDKAKWSTVQPGNIYTRDSNAVGLWYNASFVLNTTRMSIGIQADTDRNGTYETTAVGGHVWWTNHDCWGAADASCYADYYYSTQVVLNPAAFDGYEFVGWYVVGDPNATDTTGLTYAASPASVPMWVFIDRPWTIIARFRALPPPATCSLSVAPLRGVAPLTIQATVSASNMPAGTTYTYTMGDAPLTTLANRGASVYFTYGSPGSYGLTATASNGTVCSAGVTVSVVAPSSYTGGEVAP